MTRVVNLCGLISAHLHHLLSKLIEILCAFLKDPGEKSGVATNVFENPAQWFETFYQFLSGGGDCRELPFQIFYLLVHTIRNPSDLPECEPEGKTLEYEGACCHQDHDRKQGFRIHKILMFRRLLNGLFLLLFALFPFVCLFSCLNSGAQLVFLPK